MFITGIDDITGNDEYNQESLDLETGTDEYYHGTMNALQTNISGNVVQETEEDVEADDVCELLDEKDDVFAFDISDDIMHYDLSEPDPDIDSKSFEETVIFQGSKITVSAAMVLVLSFSVRFSLPSAALSNLLFLINLLLLKDSHLCKTLHYFKKHF